jgi:hypothetical protein
LIQEVGARVRDGRPVDAAGYARSHPLLWPRLCRIFPALEALSRLTRPGEAVVAGPPGALGGYRILGPIGQGGSGPVYEALQPVTGGRVALKVFPFASVMGDRLAPAVQQAPALYRGGWRRRIGTAREGASARRRAQKWTCRTQPKE